MSISVDVLECISANWVMVPALMMVFLKSELKAIGFYDWAIYK